MVLITTLSISVLHRLQVKLWTSSPRKKGKNGEDKDNVK